MTYHAPALLTSVVVFASATLSTDVEAHPEHQAEIPRAVNGCNTCHMPPRGVFTYPLNDFGDTVQQSLLPSGSVGEVNWPVVCPLDSDGDGATNGTELGDPECNWPEDPGVDTLYDPADPSIAPDGSGGGSGGGTGGGGGGSGGGTGGGSGGGTGGGTGTGSGGGTGGDTSGGSRSGGQVYTGDDRGSQYGPGGADNEGCVCARPHRGVDAAFVLFIAAASFASRRRRPLLVRAD